MTLTASYETCRRLHARFGRSYYLATRLLPSWKRRHVHALYGFARYADEIVDASSTADDRTAALDRLTARLATGLAGEPTDDHVLPAFIHTVRSFGIDYDDIDAFLQSMRADLTIARYSSYGDLLDYMEGSAAVIGTMTLPVLEPLPGWEKEAREPARQLGLAFQLTNFLRDVKEDLVRGRVYLPQDDLARFGVEESDLARPRVSPRLRELLAFEAGRAREHYRAALAGVEMLVPSSRPCVQAAHDLYGGILDEIERSDFEVLARRVQVPRHRMLATFARHLAAASAAAKADRYMGVEMPGWA
ncbi:phytoene/squalene synthase family protein [Actinocorallia sp. B10E7]|uniref:phytoene/squalene synthase family protein n=1 Tax=Actinocorallia sp. B10E7 TaxID=3153558 RepID=UPI00325E9760